MESAPDGALLAAWRRGDVAAFEALVARHQRALLAHATSLLGRGQAAHDAVQDTFLRLAKTPPRSPAPGGDAAREAAALSAWLHQVLRRVCSDDRRAERRRKRREREAAAREAVSGGQDQVDADDTRAAVERGLERLSADQREVIALRLFGERSYAEIAEITGRKVGTVGWLISEGLTRLAEELAHLMPGREALARGELR